MLVRHENPYFGYSWAARNPNHSAIDECEWGRGLLLYSMSEFQFLPILPLHCK